MRSETVNSTTIKLWSGVNLTSRASESAHARCVLRALCAQAARGHRVVLAYPLPHPGDVCGFAAGFVCFRIISPTFYQLIEAWCSLVSLGLAVSSGKARRVNRDSFINQCGGVPMDRSQLVDASFAKKNRSFGTWSRHIWCEDKNGCEDPFGQILSPGGSYRLISKNSSI